MQKGDSIFYARVLPQTGLFEVRDLHVRTVEDTWFTATDSTTKQSFLFGYEQENVNYFFIKTDAVEKVRNAQERYGNIQFTKMTEEDE